MKLIVGLGNPGPKYERTRHNVGFWVIDKLAQKHKIELTEACGAALIGRGDCSGEAIVLAKPQTFMNRSGLAVAALLRELRIDLADLLIVYDDLDLPLGRLRVRARGSAGGHRGIKSILDELGSEGFSRLRIGIDRPAPGVEVIDYVLESLNSEQMRGFAAVVDRAADAVEMFISAGVERAMQAFNSAG